MSPTLEHLFWFVIGSLVLILGMSILNILGAQYQYAVDMYDRARLARERRNKYIEDLEARQDLVVTDTAGADRPDSLKSQAVVN